MFEKNNDFEIRVSQFLQGPDEQILFIIETDKNFTSYTVYTRTIKIFPKTLSENPRIP